MKKICNDPIINSPALFSLINITEQYSAAAGGVAAMVRQLSKSIAFHGNAVHVISSSGTGMPDSSNEFALHLSFPSRLGSLWDWSTSLNQHIKCMASLDGSKIFHIHGIWMAPQYLAANAASLNSIPCVLSPHGMLEPWLWDQQGCLIHLKKALYWNLLAGPAFSTVDVVHAVTPREKQHLRKYFPKQRIEVIPNAIELEDIPDTCLHEIQRQKIILFLGRIDSVKGVDILLRAFSLAEIDHDWRVVIIGPVWSQPYKNLLDRIVNDHGLTERVSFEGAVFGDQKNLWLRKAWVLAAPSHSEVIGLVNLEAAAHYLPSITTHQTGLFDWALGGGMLIDPDVGQLKLALENACAWSDSEQLARGEASRRLVIERYSWNAVMPKWKSLYDSLS